MISFNETIIDSGKRLLYAANYLYIIVRSFNLRLNKIVFATVIELLSQPSDYCTAWDEHVNHNPDSMKEANEFQNGPEMKEVITSVSRRLGYNRIAISYGTYVLFGSMKFHAVYSSNFVVVLIQNEGTDSFAYSNTVF
jgi:hypothetical protein